MAGVLPIEPGFSKFVAMPHVSGNTPTVRATQPTPFGSITVSAVRDNHRGTVSIEVDAARPGFVGLRLADEATGCLLDLTTIMATLAGTKVVTPLLVDASTVALALVHSAMRKSHVYVEVPNGHSTIGASFDSACAPMMVAADAAVNAARATTTMGLPTINGSTSMTTSMGLPTIPPFPAASYPASWTVDTATGGDWIGKYGGAGYCLFGFDDSLPGKNLTKLPRWVKRLYAGSKANNEKGVKSKYVGTDLSKHAYLVDPRAEHKGSRSLGWASNSGNYFGADGSQGTVLNINVTKGKRYKISLYMVSGVQPKSASAGGAACPNKGMVSSPCTATKQAIRVMDLATLNPIAPEPELKEFAGGLYWSLTYDRGVRLRVMPIDGDSGFSAIFFDEA
jgi:hypothetical protein